MVACSVEKVRYANGNAGASRFYGGKRRVIVHRIVAQQNFLPAATPHVKSGKIIQSASCAGAGEEPCVRPIPEAMLLRPRRI